MYIFVDLSNRTMAEGTSQLLFGVGYGNVATTGNPPASGSTPDALIVDIAALDQERLATHPGAKVLLIDTGIEKEKLFATLLSHRIYGALAPTVELHLFKKALKAVREQQTWIDNGSVKALFHEAASILETSAVANREKDVIHGVHQGMSNNEIAEHFAMSPHTVKAHLNRPFHKLNIERRSQLPSLTMQDRQAASDRFDAQVLN